MQPFRKFEGVGVRFVSVTQAIDVARSAKRGAPPPAEQPRRRRRVSSANASSSTLSVGLAKAPENRRILRGGWSMMPRGRTDMTTLQTPRLALRPIEATDAGAVFAVYSSPEVCEFFDLRPFRELSQAEGHIARWMGLAKEGKQFRHAIIFEAQVIGTYGVYAVSGAHGRASMETAFHPIPTPPGKPKAGAPWTSAKSTPSSPSTATLSW